MLQPPHKPYSRAYLAESSIVIKAQEEYVRDDLQEDKDEDSSESHGSSVFETASLISCVTCLSDYSDRGNSKSALPANTVIPYAKILNVQEVSATPQINSPVSDPFSDENALLNNRAEFRTKKQCKDGVELYSDVIPSKRSGDLVEITYAKPRRSDLVPKTVILLVERHPQGNCTADNGDIIEEILQKSYRGTKRKKSILMIINPFGGKGKAKKLYLTKIKPILMAGGCKVEVVETEYRTHAAEIVEKIDIDSFDVIAAASGDGIPHEVLNGLYRRPDRVRAFEKLAITQLPCGSGNAMSVSCHGTDNPSYAALSLLKAVEVRMDIMCCTQPSCIDSPRLSFLSQNYGIIGESDINTEFMRWLGPTRFELGVTLNIVQKRKYPCEIHVKYAAKTKNQLKDHYLRHKERISQDLKGLGSEESKPNSTPGSEALNHENHTLSDVILDDSSFKPKWSLSDPVPSDWEVIDQDLADNLGIFYTGKMPYVAADTKFFPAALPDDGTMDVIIIDARTPLSRMVSILLSLDKGTHVLQPEVQHSKILAYRIVPKKESVFSVDGERFPFEPLQVEILPKLAKTLLKNGSYVETEFKSL
ncbi:HCL022Cp [Eremothecium sinecaudum]|uniref:sphingosine kinase n=1 Tax=Eremothecium sinecaudum TaxID=45286 RepID=A0A0X8HRI5_9SACH|nr:HCL022Cp [Eremothecium sinecaudum]AMD20129.1 HCL022Cp [Eremothecium sinecaudum]